MDHIILKLKALADKNRLRIFNALAHHEELCACQITELLQVTGATVSRHLGLMKRAGLLKSRKDGRWVLFRLDDSSGGMKSIQGWLETGLKESEEQQKDLEALDRIIWPGTGRIYAGNNGEKPAARSIKKENPSCRID